MKNNLLSVLLLLCPATLLLAQPSLQNDLSWFKEQTRQYQRWLDHDGLAQTLRVETIEVDTMVVLYLGFRYTDRDSIISAWRQLETRFDAHVGLPLEVRLFQRAASIFDVDMDHVVFPLYFLVLLWVLNRHPVGDWTFETVRNWLLGVEAAFGGLVVYVVSTLFGEK